MQADTATVPRRHSLGRMVKNSTFLLLIVIATLIFILACLILFHHNANATKGYKLRSLEFDRTQLLRKEEQLTMEIAKKQALENLQNDPLILAMKKPTKPVYVQLEHESREKFALRIMAVPE